MESSCSRRPPPAEAETYPVMLLQGYGEGGRGGTNQSMLPSTSTPSNPAAGAGASHKSRAMGVHLTLSPILCPSWLLHWRTQQLAPSAGSAAQPPAHSHSM